ncbi:MAG: lysophospholipid acyltransferase family protein [Patescibacteria group bacterium]
MKYPWFIKLALAVLKRNLEPIEGLENLPPKGNYILTPNHQSYLDPIFLWAGIVPYIKRIIYSLAKQELSWKFGKFGTNYLGMIYIDLKDKAKCLDTALEYLKRGEIVCIFPEGTRNYDRKNLLKGKTGAARLALMAKVPVIPLGIVSPPGKGVFEALKNALFPKNKARIIIGRPLNLEKYYPSEITKETLENITREIMLSIGQLCQKNYPF